MPFYYACDKDYYDRTKALKEECANLTIKDDLRCQEYLDVLREGVSVPEGQNDERLSKKVYKTAARFFVEVFVANVNQDEKSKTELKGLLEKEGLLNPSTQRLGTNQYQFFVSDGADKFKVFANSIFKYGILSAQEIHIEEY